MNNIKKSFFVFTFLFLSCVSLFAQEEPSPRSLKGIELLSGFGKSKLREQGNYYLTPIIFDLDFDLNPILKNKGINLPGLFEFQLEPFISIVNKPNSNIEVGNTFILKLGILPETFKFQPYIKAGVGFLYMSQHTREQATQFNFLEQGGVGVHYFFNKNLAVTADWRLRHVSNAAIKQPNKGINGRFYLLGLTYRF
ncbi:MAG: acyloxyacyl hydrolase [Candidatus Omnitrophota bacterium]